MTDPTPEERTLADQIIVLVMRRSVTNKTVGDGEATVQDVVSLVRAAVEAEREACLLEATTYGDKGWRRSATQIAAAIRARGGEDE